MLLHSKVSAFLEETASSSPAPGGGSVSALAGSLAAALTSMVCRLTIGKKKYAAVDAEMKSVLSQSEELRAAMADVIDSDTAAFQEVMKALSMPKETEDQKNERALALERATRTATEVPMQLLRHCESMVKLVEAVADRGNANSRSDAGVAALMISAAARGAALNIMINLGGLKDMEYVSNTRRDMDQIETAIRQAAEKIAGTVRNELLK